MIAETIGKREEEEAINMTPRLSDITIYYIGERRCAPHERHKRGNEIASDLVETHRRMMPGERDGTQNESAADSLLRRNKRHIISPDH